MDSFRRDKMQRQVFLMLFKLMYKKGLLTSEQMQDLDDSMHGTTPDELIDVINKICEGD